MRCIPTLAAFAKRLKDAGKPRKIVVIAVARKLAVIANAMIRDGTQWNPEANGKASAESKSVATSGEKLACEAKPDETCKRRRASSGGRAIEPEVPARGGSSRSLGWKPSDRSGKTLEQTSRVDCVPDRAERREICVLSYRAASGRQRELRIDSGADRIEARPAGRSPFAGRIFAL